MHESLYELVAAEARDGIRVIADHGLGQHARGGSEVAFEADLAAMNHWCRINEQLVIERHREQARVFTGFEKLSRARGVRRRYAQLAERAQELTVFGLPDWQVPFAATVVPVAEGPLLEEWFVAVQSPRYAALIIAQDLAGVDAPPGQRRFRGFASHDPALVDRAVGFLEGVRARWAA